MPEALPHAEVVMTAAWDAIKDMTVTGMAVDIYRERSDLGRVGSGAALSLLVGEIQEDESWQFAIGFQAIRHTFPVIGQIGDTDSAQLPGLLLRLDSAIVKAITGSAAVKAAVFEIVPVSLNTEQPEHEAGLRSLFFERLFAATYSISRTDPTVRGPI